MKVVKFFGLLVSGESATDVDIAHWARKTLEIEGQHEGVLSSYSIMFGFQMSAVALPVNSTRPIARFGLSI